jgi:carboxyl-terminal processing protease
MAAQGSDGAVMTMPPATRLRPGRNMSKTAKATILGISLALVLFTVVGGLGVGASTSDGAYRQLGVFSEVLSRIRSEYVEEPNLKVVTDGALHGLLESLDANSSYLNPTEYKQFKERKGEAKGDVGTALSKRFGYAAVIAVLPGSPAEKAGLDGGDIIEAIEGRSTREMSLAEVRALLAGDPGTSVNVSVVRARRSAPLRLTLTREALKPPPVAWRMLEGNIGYLKTEALSAGKAQEVAAAIRALERAGARKLILDLRNAAHGEQAEGIALANLFMKQGLITYLQGQKYPRETFQADAAKAVTALPLVVLVNRGTAGPGEIAAAAIMETARGDVVGDKTFGVGSVQRVIEIPDGSALILSVAKYYSPSGKAIQDDAVTPNVLVAAAEEVLVLGEEEVEGVPAPSRQKPEEDEQLKRAIEVLKNRPA